MKTKKLFTDEQMALYGNNPHGAPLFRVLLADSRTDMIGGKWPDGACEYRQTPRYTGMAGKWIMEKWLSAEEYAGTPETYRQQQFDPVSGLLTCGPYPRAGEYTLCHTFVGKPTESQVGWAIRNLKLSRDLTPGARKQGITEPLEKQQRDQDARFSDIWDNAMGPWQSADAVVSFGPNHGRQGFKRGGDLPVERFDQSSPLPTHDNFFGTIQRQETIDKLTGDADARNSQ